jgi:predicted site-specific integrase-resolvase
MTATAIRFQTVPEKSLFRPDEVAAIFRVHIRTVYNWYFEGKLDGVKISQSCLRFPHEAVIKLLNSSS